MFGLSWLRLGLFAVIAVLVAGAVWYVIFGGAHKANERATTAVTTTIAKEQPKEAAKAVEANAKTSDKILTIEHRSATHGSAVVGSADPDREFYLGVCDGELYKNDPQCRSGGRVVGGRHGTGGSR